MSKSAKDSLTAQFADFARGFSLSEAPQSIVDYARMLVLDLIGCAIGGLGTPESAAALSACQHLEGTGGRATLWGTGLQASPGGAAMFNGIISHVLELDDFLGIDHTGAVVLPALFAVMDHEGRYEETRFIEAMTLGYELGRRILETGGGYSKHNSTGWHTTGTVGSFAAAIAVSKYLGLSQAQTVSALGLAGSVTGGTWAFNLDGAMSKRLHPGIAARNGITAAYLAREGFIGPKYILEAEWGGYFALHAANHDCDLDAIWTGLGEDLRLGHAGIKPYACCRGNHSAIDVMHDMRNRNEFSLANLDHVRVECSPSQIRQLGNKAPKTVAEAQLSMPFAIATAIRFDTIGPGRFTHTEMAAQETQAIAEKVVFTENKDWPAGKEPEFQVSLLGGAGTLWFRSCGQGRSQ